MIKTFNPIPEEIRETHNVYFGIPELVIKKTKIIFFIRFCVFHKYEFKKLIN